VRPREFKQSMRDVLYLRRTGAPLHALSRYFPSRFGHAPVALQTYTELAVCYQARLSNLQTSNAWFTKNLPIWLSILAKWEKRLPESPPKHGLEIGSWEGVSAHFILSRMNSLHLTCVDTFEGADEHKNSESASSSLGLIEDRFDRNLSEFAQVGRLTKEKTTSHSFLANCKKTYDFIYIDGSHHAPAVVCDAMLAWQRLNSGGLMIFDDYLWKFYSHELDNPASAINYFLKLVKNESQILFLWEQVFLLKQNPEESA